MNNVLYCKCTDNDGVLSLARTEDICYGTYLLADVQNTNEKATFKTNSFKYFAFNIF